MALNGISLGQARPAQARRELNPFLLFCYFFFSNPATRHTNATSVPSKLNQICVAALPKAFASHTHTERETDKSQIISQQEKKFRKYTHTHTDTNSSTHAQRLIGCCSPLQSFRQGGWLPCTVCARFPQLRCRASPSESEAPAQLGSLRFSSTWLGRTWLCSTRQRTAHALDLRDGNALCVLCLHIAHTQRGRAASARTC